MGVLDAIAIGRSDPLGKMCEITAPRPHNEAYTANHNDNIGPQWASAFAGSIRSLKALKAFVHSGAFPVASLL